MQKELTKTGENVRLFCKSIKFKSTHLSAIETSLRPNARTNNQHNDKLAFAMPKGPNILRMRAAAIQTLYVGAYCHAYTHLFIFVIVKANTP